MFKRMFTENEIKKLAKTASGGDSTVLVEIEMQGGTLTADVLAKVNATPYNVVFTPTNMYLIPVGIAISGTTSLIYTVVGSGGGSLSAMSIQINKETGVYTISM